jgi:hypothetical protein
MYTRRGARGLDCPLRCALWFDSGAVDMGEERKERPPRDRLLIEAKLRRRLEVARAKHKLAVEELHQLRAEPRDLPDRALRITVAMQAHREAIDAYRAALKHLNAFIRHDRVPDNL